MMTTPYKMKKCFAKNRHLFYPDVPTSTLEVHNGSETQDSHDTVPQNSIALAPANVLGDRITEQRNHTGRTPDEPIHETESDDLYGAAAITTTFKPRQALCSPDTPATANVKLMAAKELDTTQQAAEAKSHAKQETAHVGKISDRVIPDNNGWEMIDGPCEKEKRLCFRR